ncbi:MAG: hypothetical protein KME27_09040 [Lyngbya sp. HA4199-MV5]|nr:hypothetical protein [Lyngbya sp. HA4199-MV5]
MPKFFLSVPFARHIVIRLPYDTTIYEIKLRNLSLKKTVDPCTCVELKAACRSLLATGRSTRSAAEIYLWC